MSEHVQTIQKTSKKWKLLHLISSTALIASIIYLISAAGGESDGREAEKQQQITFAVTLLSGSILLYLVTRILIWWHHG